MNIDPRPNKTVRELLTDIKDGEYVIPHFQRGYEWTPSMVADLIVSIIQNYFSGLLLFWQINPEVIKGEEWDPLWGAEKPKNPSFAVLDGQQRLASLYYAICGPPKKFPSRDSYYMFFLDLGKYISGLYEEAIFYRYFLRYINLDKIISRKDEWIKESVLPLRLLMDQRFIDSREFNNWIREYVRRFMKNKDDIDEYDQLRDSITGVVRGILNYEFVTYILGEDRELSDVCSIFARINQKGMKLSTFDLMNAFLFPKGVYLKKLWENLDDKDIREIDSNMNEYLLKLMSLCKQDYCSSKYIYYLIPGYKVKKKDDLGKTVELILVKDGKEFQNLWNKSCLYTKKAIEKIMNVGKDDFGAIKHDFVPNTTIIPVMGALLMEFEDKYRGIVSEGEFYNILSKWYWSAVISGEYSGSSDTVMSEDYRDLKNWFTERKISAIRRIKGKKLVDEQDLKNCRKGSSLYNAVLCLIALSRVEDFYTLRVLDTGTYTGERIHDHHIFPTKVKGAPPDHTREFGATKDSILNRTLLFDQTNERIKSSKPSQYLKEILNKLSGDKNKLEELMGKHFISKKCLGYLGNDNYDGFIEEREKTIRENLIKVVEW